MKRDMDLIRAILVEAEAAAADELIEDVEGCDSSVFAYHVGLMEQAGLVDGTVVLASGHIPVKAHVFGDGHDFLDAVRSDSVWSKTRARVAESVGSVSFDVLKTVAGSIAIRMLTG